MATVVKTRPKPTSVDTLFKGMASMGVDVVERIEKVPRRSTGIMSLDLIWGGGLPMGRMMLHFGDQATGKTTMWQLIARNLINRGEPVLWIDAERTLERGYMELLGLDPDARDAKGRPLFTVVKPETAEQGFDALIMALELGFHKLIVLDTLAKLLPAVEADSSVGKAEMTQMARLASRLTRVYARALEQSNATFVVLNQARVDIGSYGAPLISSGGKAINAHEPSIAIKSGRNENQFADGKPAQLRFCWTITKTKVGRYAPVQSVADYPQLRVLCSDDAYEVDFGYELYFAADRLALLKDKEGKRWTKLGAYFEGDLLATGKEKVAEFFNVSSPLRDRIEAAIYKAIADGITTGNSHGVSDANAGQAESEAEESPADDAGLGDSD
jgi:RecA/RadA recombinase